MPESLISTHSPNDPNTPYLPVESPSLIPPHRPSPPPIISDHASHSTCPPLLSMPPQMPDSPSLSCFVNAQQPRCPTKPLRPHGTFSPQSRYLIPEPMPHPMPSDKYYSIDLIPLKPPHGPIGPPSHICQVLPLTNRNCLPKGHCYFASPKPSLPVPHHPQTYRNHNPSDGPDPQF